MLHQAASFLCGDAMRITIDLALDEHIVQALSIALKERDAPTMSHCQRVSKLACTLGYFCGVEDKEMSILYAASYLHDMGKIGIPDSILLKPSRLTDEEFEIIKTHPELGERIMREIPSPLAKKAAKVIRHHHEHFNGNGYPEGLSGDDIPFLSRVVFIADSYDGIISPRSYHGARTHDEAMRIFVSELGAAVDASIFKVFASKIGKPDFSNIFISII